MTISATLPDPLVQRLQSIDKLISSGQFPKAAKELNAALKLAPRDPRVYLLGGRMAEAAGNAKGAQDAFRKAVSLTPDWPVAVTELAFLLARQNEAEEAMVYAQRAFDLDSNNPELLSRVIDVAHRTLNFGQALTWLERAVAVAPGNTQFKRLLARDLRVVGRYAEAGALYDQLIAASPDDSESLLGRVQLAMAMKTPEAARQDCEKLVALHPGNEEMAYWLALSRGEVPDRQPESMVRELFDGFADVFDQHLVGNLKYTLPREVARIINERYPDRTLNVLDLGCGTGLLGFCLGRIQGALIGVDLSQRMIQHAMLHNVYDRFHTVDVLDALQETPPSLYDVVAALDVFVYIGNLTQAIPNALRILKPGGHLIFSCERAADGEADLVLRTSQRYAHKASYIEGLCRGAGFSEVTVQDVQLRLDNNAPVEGFLVVARKAADSAAPITQ